MKYTNKLDVRSTEFDRLFTYDGNDLGATYTKEATTLKVWAPTANKVDVLVDHKDTSHTHSMTLGDKGVYSITLEGDYELASYVYEVHFDEMVNTATDPYAIASTANHEKTVIVDPAKLKVESNKADLPEFNNYTDAIIYEIHVRDFSTDPNSGLKNKGKFLAFTEEGVKTSGGKISGIDYIQSLGVTHIQLLPVYDFGSVDELDQYKKYNWGYDPVQYNVPEGSYGTDVNDPYTRIIELKQAIAKAHEKGLRVTMDVVYNHMYDMTTAFEKIVPGYYFRLGEDGEISNGSFCGNDIDSLRPMMHKFILESTRIWIEDYGFDGFRFDLMGIIDIDTMNAVEAQTKEIDPNAMVYGEGWNMPSLMPEEKKSMMDNHKMMPGIAHFSDIFRDNMKGGTIVNDEFDVKGYGTGDFTKVAEAAHVLLATSQEVKIDKKVIEPYFVEPTFTVNYVECHDNNTLWDKIEMACPKENVRTRQMRHRFITTYVLISQGIPFVHAGQEFFRTKFGEENSFESSDEVNMIRWQEKDANEENIQYVRDLCAFRKAHKLLRLTKAAEIEQYVSVKTFNEVCLQYMLSNEEESLEILINPTTEIQEVSLEGAYTILLDQKGASNQPVTGLVKIKPLEILCLRK